ncbi:winged helix-turn-helix domain-containing protein [Halostagnicola kamekurae]|uniref:Helix-turn-helix domain-containing protein n=1 Tax=Halostagnicola kamekurae TaxID=619731 RepID=A0A1I6Q683_9EURY|nr:helix-turn-helix domain-containing protein [Halostagnicola kamekurae]SFS47983.1 Helix-turn-helix domain-containing protein [Halostagnicola kamekurae]
MDPASSFPDDAFRVLSHDVRLIALVALEDAQTADSFAADPVSYSELADRVDDYHAEAFDRDAGNFDYHLRKLREAGFISRVDGGYRIRQAGVQVVRAIRAGDITDRGGFETVTIDEPCPYCGGTSAITLEDDWLFIHCLDCVGAFAQDESLPAGTLAGFEVSPTGIRNREPLEAFRTAFRMGMQVHRLFAAGICPECSGTTTTHTLETCPAHDPGGSGVCPECGRTTEEFFAISCDVCQRSLMSFPAIVVATDPHVIAVMYERGRDVTDQTWIALSKPPDWPCRSVETDPAVLEYTIPVPDGEAIRVRLDDSLTVTICNP